MHIAGTRNVVEAARRVGVKKIALMSFLRARPNCGSPYHESKWAAEEIIRNSGLDYTIVKAGMIYGRGDHMLDHLSHSLHTLPFFATVGFKEKPIRPLAIDDLVRILRAALVDARLNRQTVPVTGAEQLNLSEAARRVAGATSRRILILPAPVWFHFVLAQIFEFSMTIPLVAKAQVVPGSHQVTGRDCRVARDLTGYTSLQFGNGYDLLVGECLGDRGGARAADCQINLGQEGPRRGVRCSVILEGFDGEDRSGDPRQGE